MFRVLGNLPGDPPSPSEIVVGQTKVATSGTPVQLTATSTSLRNGVWFNSNETGTKKHYIGTTASKPTYDSGATGAKSSGQICMPYNPVFWECSDLSDIWLDASTDNRTMCYLAY